MGEYFILQDDPKPWDMLLSSTYTINNLTHVKIITPSRKYSQRFLHRIKLVVFDMMKYEEFTQKINYPLNPIEFM